MSNYSLSQIVRFFYSNASGPEKRRFCFLCLLNVVVGFFEISVAGGISLLGVAMSSPNSLEQIPFLGEIANSLPFSIDVPSSLRMLMVIMICVFLATVAKNIFLGYLTWQQNYFAQRISWGIGKKLFKHFLSAPYLWHTTQNSAELLTVLNWKAFVAAFIVSVLTLLTQAVIALFLFAGALATDPLMSAFLFLTVIIFTFIIQKYSKKKVYEVSSFLKNYDIHVSKVAMQGLQGIREIVIYDKRTSFLQQYSKNIESYSSKYSIQSVFPNIPQWSLECIGMGLLALVLLWLICAGTSIAKATGLITLLAAVSWRLLPATNKALGALLMMRGQQPMIEKILGMFSVPLFSLPSDKKIQAVNSIIELQDISFTYPSASREALRNVSLVIPKGKMVGFVGVSGSGKSTLTGIITGLIPAERGKILIDGKPLISEVSRLKVGYVPQSLYLLDASLAENIAFSHWGEDFDENRVRECCRLAAIDFLADLPNDIYTELGERGVRLSGGQIQRVGIARALYDNPDLLLFDEATSALDGAAENAIQNTINSLRSTVTVLVVAHRLSTVASCDIIYWIDQGRVVASGEPDVVLPQYQRKLSQLEFTDE